MVALDLTCPDLMEPGEVASLCVVERAGPLEHVLHVEGASGRSTLANSSIGLTDRRCNRSPPSPPPRRTGPSAKGSRWKSARWRWTRSATPASAAKSRPSLTWTGETVTPWTIAPRCRAIAMAGPPTPHPASSTTSPGPMPARRRQHHRGGIGILDCAGRGRDQPRLEAGAGEPEERLRPTVVEGGRCSGRPVVQTSWGPSSSGRRVEAFCSSAIRSSNCRTPSLLM